MKLPAVFATVARMRREQRRVVGRKARSRRAHGPTSLMEWVPYASPELDEPVHLEAVCDELQKVIRGEVIEVCLSVPPRHGKSTTVHHAIAMFLAADPTRRVLYGSYDLDFAAENLEAIRKICLSIGLALGKVDRKDKFTLAEGGSVTACGIQSPPTGRGYHLVIIDDPIRRLADALSPAIRNRIGRGFSSDLYSRQTAGSKKRARVATSFVIIQTRWHEDDLYGRQKKKGWTCFNLPAIVEREGRMEALAPDMFPLGDLEKIRRENDQDWSSLYMGDPSPRTGRLFGDVHFVTAAALPKTYRAAFGVDIARKAKQRSDRNGFAEMLHHDGKTYVVKFFGRRMPLTDHRDASGKLVAEGFTTVLGSAMQRRPGARAVQYTGGDEDLVLDLLSKAAAGRVHIEARRAVTDKRQRAQPAAAAWNRGDLLVLEGQPWTADYIEHMARFTGDDGAEDEEADCTAAGFDVLNESAGRITPPKTSTRGERLGTRRGVIHT